MSFVNRGNEIFLRRTRTKHGPGSVVFSFEQYTVCRKSVCPKSYKSFLQSKNISTCLLWFSWWLCTKIPRRCDTDNNVEKVTKLVGLWFCHYGFGMSSQSAPVSRETPCAAGDFRLMPNGPPSRCLTAHKQYMQKRYMHKRCMQMELEGSACIGPGLRCQDLK